MTTMHNTEHDIDIIYKRHQSKMLRLATLLLKDTQAAEDTVSDVFLSLSDCGIGNVANIEGYLLTTVRNRCLNRLKSLSHREKVKRCLPIENVPDNISCNDYCMEAEERMQAIEAFILENLTLQTQTVMRMRFRENMKYAEIATKLNISEAAVYKHLAQGIRKLRQRFNP
ncbi:sigma-70 family RNA polymerase sigma factor [Prevotella sp. PINT]|jgi:RNA polymerase sigma factor, sigma-70 family|uniref:sigma-70 family RNA polymerase sigma factor n=1 Tax=Palleniella intestinalis TaxID=2736291 RepID=UPI001557AD12|nr:sigma-70 family RNA polymerase sigma factor [Palleniella intestinalis]NPD80468.1 sigma-70 family RNA polymerase sigma factor [Palleniella intestinalis]